MVTMEMLPRAPKEPSTLLAKVKNKSKMKTNVPLRYTVRLVRRPESDEELKDGQSLPKRVVKPKPGFK